jgi:hypothetical protein
MSYTIEPFDVTSMAKERVIDPRSKKKQDQKMYKWWLAQSDGELMAQFLSTMEYLKKTNINRIRQASVFARLFCGKPLYNFLASTSTLDSSNQLPIGRPTANVVYSCTDTLVSRLTQDKPKPVFLTDGGHYKERRLADEANAFLQGELFRLKAYAEGTMIAKDACVLGDGLFKVYPNFTTGKVCADRTLETELLVDFNDGYYGKPRSIIHPKLVDRSVFAEMYPKAEAAIMAAQSGQVDATPRSTETVTDQFICGEGWHLPSGPDADDGRHVIVCNEGVILDEPWDKPKFPFVKFGFNPNLVGWFSQGLAEILMPTQMEIYRMLIVASQSIELMGVPRIYIDEMSKIMETSFNNRIGTIIKGRGNPPEFLNAISNAPEIYQWIQWLIQNAYQMSGVSQLSAAGQKPQGLNSGEAQREFMNIQDDRFNSLSERYKDMYIDLSYLIIDSAKDIVEKTGKYTTVYPGKDGTREVDLKEIRKLIDDDYIIQCFEESSLPKDPAGRQAKLSEMLAAGEIDNQEFRRLSNFPDLKQSDQLAAALENRILHALDQIVEQGDKDYADIAPDAFILDPSDLATKLCVNYINLYSTLELEEEKMQVLRNWFTQVQGLKQQAMPPPVQTAPTPQSGPQQGAPQTPPTQPPAAPMGPASGVAP